MANGTGLVKQVNQMKKTDPGQLVDRVVSAHPQLGERQEPPHVYPTTIADVFAKAFERAQMRNQALGRAVLLQSIVGGRSLTYTRARV